MNGRLLLGRTMSVRTVDESTSHEDMFGADADWEDVRHQHVLSRSLTYVPSRFLV